MGFAGLHQGSDPFSGAGRERDRDRKPEWRQTKSRSLRRNGPNSRVPCFPMLQSGAPVRRQDGVPRCSLAASAVGVGLVCAAGLLYCAPEILAPYPDVYVATPAEQELASVHRAPPISAEKENKIGVVRTECGPAAGKWLETGVRELPIDQSRVSSRPRIAFVL